MFIAFSPKSSVGQLLMLRSIAILIQVIMILVSVVVLEKNLKLLPIFSVIIIESIFQLLSIYVYRNQLEAKPLGMTMQLLADIVFLAILLSLSGGASNAFVSLLILPCIIAAVIVPMKHLLVISSAAIGAYLFLYFSFPMHHGHHDMSQHVLGMMVNFIFIVIVIMTVVTVLVKQLKSKEQQLAQIREQQLKQEQLLALGSAAAQATHQLATPLAHLGFLHEELSEMYPHNEAVSEMKAPLDVCQTQLSVFRAQTELLKKGNEPLSQSIGDVIEQLVEMMALQFPEQSINIALNHKDFNVSGDAMLIPGLLNLCVNAAKSNESNQEQLIAINSKIIDNCWTLKIIDNGKGVEVECMADLGHALVESKQGFGMALILSNATIERLGGTLSVRNIEEGGAVSEVILPIIE